MTVTLRAAGAAPGKPKKAAGLTACLLPVWMLHRVSGNEIVHLIDQSAKLMDAPAEC